MGLVLYDSVKRMFDVALAVILGTLLFPLILAVSLIVLVRDGKPVFFRQIRAGRGGLPFFVYKFRTMYSQESDHALKGKSGTPTALGAWLRRFSLDELPQLLNILQGHMSFVGPRPLPIEYVALYSPEQRKRLDVRPGLSGLAQVSGRNNLDWEKKFEIDATYVSQRSLLLDLNVILRTIWVVLRGRGIYPQNMESVEPFLGNQD